MSGQVDAQLQKTNTHAAEMGQCTLVQPEPDPHVWGETYAFWCQTAMLALAAILAAIAVWRAGVIERRKAAAEVIFSSRRDDELRKAIRHVILLHAGDQNIARYAKADQLDTDASKLIRYALNHYEYISVGIQQHIYDEQIFFDSMHTTVKSLYSKTKPYIDEARGRLGAPTVYQEFEWLACRWKDRKVKPKKIHGQAN